MNAADWTVGDAVTWTSTDGTRTPANVMRIGAARVTVLIAEDGRHRHVSVPPQNLTARTEPDRIDAAASTYRADTAPPQPKNAARLAALERVNAKRRLRTGEATAAYRARMPQRYAERFEALTPEQRGKVIAAGLDAHPAPF